MAMSVRTPVLLLGGTGVVGSRTVDTLRRLHPNLPIAIAGRDQEKARALADRAGDVQVAQVDLGRADLGLDPGASYSAVVAILKENTLNPLRYAQAHGIPYLSMADGAFEIGPAVAFSMYEPESAPMLLASHWAAGMATMPALHFVGEFSSVRSVEVAVVLDPEDLSGPMAHEDVEQLMEAARPLLLHDGTWRWVDGKLAERRVEAVSGGELEAQAMAVLDVLSLAAATDAGSVRFDVSVAPTGGDSDADAAPHHMIFEIEGERRGGGAQRSRFEIEVPDGISGLTALGVAIGIERLLGLVGGPPVAPGLHFPELIVDPGHAIRRLEEFGGVVRRVGANAAPT